METYVIQAQPRDLVGRKAARLRRQGLMPAVLYGHSVEPLSIAVAQGEMARVYRKAGGSSVVAIKLDGKKRNVLIQAVQDNPITGEHLHADFYQVRMDEKIKATVPLVFDGVSPAVRELDGTFVTNLDEIEVECLPADLPHEITVSIESLATFEDTITVADIPVPDGATIAADPETNVALVIAPRLQSELDELETPAELDMDAVESETASGTDDTDAPGDAEEDAK